MSGFDTEHVAGLLRQLGQNSQLIAQTYVFGGITCDDANVKHLMSLHKAGILRPDDEHGDYRTSADVKRMLNRLMRQQSSYRQMTDMGKVIDALADTVADYRHSIKQDQLDDAEYYLEQLDDLLYDTKDNLSSSLDNMHYAISSQFGFVANLSAKIRENQRALEYANKLLVELKQIDPDIFYQWIDGPCPSDFARKITGFINWFRQILARLAHIIEKMRQSLFKLRRDEKQANQLRSMARHLRNHPEFEISPELYEDPELPQTLKIAPKMPMQAYANVRSTATEQALIDIVQSLRKSSAVHAPKIREISKVEVSPIEDFAIEDDFFELATESLFEQSLIKEQPISAIEFWLEQQNIWQGKDQYIAPKDWIELVFSCYCKLTNDQQNMLGISMKEEQVKGTNNNYTFSDVVIAANTEPVYGI